MVIDRKIHGTHFYYIYMATHNTYWLNMLCITNLSAYLISYCYNNFTKHL